MASYIFSHVTTSGWKWWVVSSPHLYLKLEVGISDVDGLLDNDLVVLVEHFKWFQWERL